MDKFKQRNGLNLDTFVLKRRLGGGNFSEVYEATNAANHQFALKILEATNFEFCIDDLLHETTLMWQCLENENVVSAYTMFRAPLKDDSFSASDGRVQDPNSAWKKPSHDSENKRWESSDFRLVIVMEYCPGKTLTSYIKGAFLINLVHSNYPLFFSTRTHLHTPHITALPLRQHATTPQHISLAHSSILSYRPEREVVAKEPDH